jgi:hypothetical protein
MLQLAVILFCPLPDASYIGDTKNQSARLWKAAFFYDFGSFPCGI